MNISSYNQAKRESVIISMQVCPGTGFSVLWFSAHHIFGHLYNDEETIPNKESAYLPGPWHWHCDIWAWYLQEVYCTSFSEYSTTNTVGWNLEYANKEYCQYITDLASHYQCNVPQALTPNFWQSNAMVRLDVRCCKIWIRSVWRPKKVKCIEKFRTKSGLLRVEEFVSWLYCYLDVYQCNLSNWDRTRAGTQ